MRYMNIPNISFETLSGTSFSIKDFREYPSSYTKMMSYKVNSSDMVDEIASHKDIYGEGGEMDSYRIVDMNIVKLVEAGFNLAKLKSIDIPDNQ